MTRRWPSLLVVLSLSSVGLGQNLLVNPSFTNPAVAADCQEDWQDVEGWNMTIQSTPEHSGERRNGDYKQPPCPRDGDGVHASLQGWGFENKKAWQTVSGLTPGQAYQFSGQWFFAHDLVFGKLVVTAELRDGTDPDSSTLIAQVSREFAANGTTGSWLPFAVCGAPTGTQLTVVVRANNQDIVGFALHVDDTKLEAVTSCPAEPNAVESISPNYAAQGATVNDAIIVGSGFAASGMGVKLTREGEADIVATDIRRLNSTNMTCDFNLTGKANGRWNVVVTFPQGAPTQDVLPGGFIIATPTLSNGSFELPTAAGGCPVTPIPGAPTHWLVTTTGTWGEDDNELTQLYRDSDVGAPTCPPPDGVHYGSTASTPRAPGAQPESRVYQTIKVTPGTTYTISGYFAGIGRNTSVLELLDGDETAPAVAAALLPSSGAFDWTYAFAQISPSSELMTVQMRVTTRNAGPHALHADAITMQVCAGTLLTFGMTPVDGDNAAGAHGPIVNATITGLGFSGGALPTVQLTRLGQPPITGTSVTVVSDGELTCTFDLTGRRTGKWDLVIFKDGCVASIPGGFIVAAPTLANGSFELPDPGAPIDCGPPPVIVRGMPESWSAELSSPGAFERDHDVWAPTPCPSPNDGGHYGSMTIGAGSGLMVAYQTLRVDPSKTYTFGGDFYGGGFNIVYLDLYDGAIDGTPIAETIVHDGSADENAYGWIPATVVDSSLGTIMTVAWRLEVLGDGTVAPGIHGAHADGLYFFEGTPCATPPTVSSVNPAQGTVDTLVNDLVITGTNYVDGQTGVRLRKAGEPDVVATDVHVAPGGASLTCDLDLSGAAEGMWTVAVTVATCPPTATLVNGFEVVFSPCNTPAQDLDADGDVDLSDFSVFLACFNGPNRPWPGPPVPQQDCECLDQDTDTDVDLADFGKFLSCFNGPGRPAAAGCFLN